MSAFSITGAIDANADSNVFFRGETVFAYNTASSQGGTSVKLTGLYGTSGDARYRSRVRRFRYCRIAEAQILVI